MKRAWIMGGVWLLLTALFTVVLWPIDPWLRPQIEKIPAVAQVGSIEREGLSLNVHALTLRLPGNPDPLNIDLATLSPAWGRLLTFDPAAEFELRAGDDRLTGQSDSNGSLQEVVGALHLQRWLPAYGEGLLNLSGAIQTANPLRSDLTATLSGATLRYMGLALPVDTLTFKGAGDGGKWSGTLIGAGLDLKIALRATPDGAINATLSGLYAPASAQRAQLAPFLRMIGNPDPQGRFPIQWSGVVPL
ncbi:MAG: hypothetical protein COX57_02735 [Alphaproteobacteria bacterium CG_4_10_14_0_2_um_filter_63_37]|nr:MAG: hypothetical protein AUJ55_10290 [Proteobacteria bacterium CG1_02_64_396]PJA25593.1 MAG: hypothetical protein COX57_02735 [Alphaproteobacteria bacterium CG_4_10_14_0_2_um_filter_63_37]